MRPSQNERGCSAASQQLADLHLEKGPVVKNSLRLLFEIVRYIDIIFFTFMIKQTEETAPPNWIDE